MKPAIALSAFCVFVCIVLPSVAAWQCAPLLWTMPRTWYAGELLETSVTFPDCSKMIRRNDLYPCAIAKPPTECGKGQICPEGTLCSFGMFPQMCVKCENTIGHTWYETEYIETNVTASMLAGKFWTKSDFYNHTGVDLILTRENWVWSPSGNSLAHDQVQHTRTTWGDAYDMDRFITSTSVYSRFNTTHVKVDFASSSRDSFDNGKLTVQGQNLSFFYPAVVPPAVPMPAPTPVAASNKV